MLFERSLVHRLRTPWYTQTMAKKMTATKIISDPEIMFGKPVIAGTRITVEHVLEELAHGIPFQDLIDSYPTLTKEGILAALEYAAGVLKSDVVIPAERAR